MVTELTWKTGGYPHTYHVSRAGGYGCNPCWHCQRRPGRGEYVWTNTYGDLYCNRCAQRLAANHTP
jgi:hypothetical protein